MAQHASPGVDKPVILLALDGGGIRGLSELLILDEIMRRVKYDLNLTEMPRPCEYFDLIGGTSTGGLIALMLGRLRMSTDEALRAYNSLACTIFSKNNRKRKGQDGMFKASTLENKVKEVVSKKDLGDRMLDPSTQSSKGKAFVCAVPANNMEHPRRFRTYPVRTLASVNCKIWEAARATTAAPTFFKRIAIGEEDQALEEFVDGGLKCNNPANQVLDEARDVYGNDRLVRCLISIGTGHPGTIGLSKPDTFQKFLPTKLIDVLKKIATDCEKTANDISVRFRDVENFYFRFNVVHGAEGISLEEWEKLGILTEHTKAYMSRVSVSKDIDKIVHILCHPENTGITLRTICGVPHILKLPQPVRVRPQPIPSPIFTGREDVIETLEKFFSPRPYGPTPRREYLLHGLGGAGKTQVALQFAKKYQNRFSRIYWIDASNRPTIEQSYKAIAADNNIDSSSKDSKEAQVDRDTTTALVLRWFANLNQEWLLLFDNCESIKNLHDFVPHGPYGNILFTSRDPTLGLTLPPNTIYEISEMENEDAITLLLRASRLNDKEMDEGLRQRARPVAKILGFLPLAIDIAGASIHMGRYDLDDYINTFRDHREIMMKDSTFTGASRYNQAVYTAWDISYDTLKSFAKGSKDSTKCQDAKAALQILNLCAFWHNEGIMEEIFRRAAENQHLTNDPKAQYSFDYATKVPDLLKVNVEKNWDPFLFRKGVSTLLSFSLMKQDRSKRYFSMHVLVHSWARDHIPSTAKPHQLYIATALLSSSISWRYLTEDYTFRRQLLPHIKECKKHGEAAEIIKLDNLEDASKFSLVFYEGGHWQEAEELEVQVMETRKRVLGEEHPESRAMEGGRRAVCASDGDVQEGAWGGASRHADQHG
ncbi:FabD/lysophospholipase-like protein [Patellaria atrata CBS 101060]|uniref:FabD/lysophospholipase-like protein n=1 Tax=Patellaria atrata CBS 101060 TaxID=1346257 RepID=A0A9P4VMQ0_9PEZI|nr:FabD/lysophospholipase-like protein [Patellaria atrata CBS 101060]